MPRTMFYWRDGEISFNPGTIGCFYFGHLITRSALASTFGGIVRPICFAVLRLITSSNLVGCSTGRSAGLAPLQDFGHSTFRVVSGVDLAAGSLLLTQGALQCTEPNTLIRKVLLD
jgi:hypothetical protein